MPGVLFRWQLPLCSVRARTPKSKNFSPLSITWLLASLSHSQPHSGCCLVNLGWPHPAHVQLFSHPQMCRGMYMFSKSLSLYNSLLSWPLCIVSTCFRCFAQFRGTTMLHLTSALWVMDEKLFLDRKFGSHGAHLTSFPIGQGSVVLCCLPFIAWKWRPHVFWQVLQKLMVRGLVCYQLLHHGWKQKPRESCIKYKSIHGTPPVKILPWIYSSKGKGSNFKRACRLLWDLSPAYTPSFPLLPWPSSVLGPPVFFQSLLFSYHWVLPHHSSCLTFFRSSSTSYKATVTKTLWNLHKTR